MKKELSTDAAAKSGQKLCPVCKHSVNRCMTASDWWVTFFPFLSLYECQRCKSQWTPAINRNKTAGLAVLGLIGAVIVFLFVDSAYIHGRGMENVNSNDKPIALAGVIFSLAAGSVGLLNVFFLIISLIRTPTDIIQRKGAWPPSPDKPTSQADGTVAQSNVKKNEGQDPQ